MSSGDEANGDSHQSNGSAQSVEELDALFKRYCVLGTGHGSKKQTLNQTQMNKMFMDAGIYKEFPKLDRNVLAIYWSYAFKKEKEIDFATAVAGWQNIFADRYNIDSKGEVSKEDFWQRFQDKLGLCEGPKLAATKVRTCGVMERLTDESKYTGTHKQRAAQSAQAAKPKKLGGTTMKPSSAKATLPAHTAAASSVHKTVSKPSATRQVATSNGTR